MSSPPMPARPGLVPMPAGPLGPPGSASTTGPIMVAPPQIPMQSSGPPVMLSPLSPGTMPPSMPVRPSMVRQRQTAHPLWLVVALLVLLLIGLGVWALLQATRHSGAGQPGPTSQHQVAAGAPIGAVSVQAHDFLSQPADRTTTELRKLVAATPGSRPTPGMMNRLLTRTGTKDR
jgi:hypothetical protein